MTFHRTNLFATLVVFCCNVLGADPCVGRQLTIDRFSVETISFIGELDSEHDDELYGDVRDVAVSPDGKVFVPDHLAMTIRRVNAHGDVEMEYGGRGAAPGEFSAISAIAVDKSGNLVVADWRTSRFTRFSPDGSFETVPIDRDAIYAPRRMLFLDGIGLVVLSAPRPARVPDQYLLRIIDARDLTTVIASFADYHKLEVDTTAYARSQLGFNPGNLAVRSTDSTIFFAPFLYDGRVFQFGADNHKWVLERVLHGVVEGPAYTLVPPDERGPSVTVIKSARRGTSAARIHNQSAGLHVSQAEVIHYSISRFPSGRRLVRESFDASGEYKRAATASLEFPLFTGPMASIEFRASRADTTYIVDNREYPRILVGRIVTESAN